MPPLRASARRVALFLDHDGCHVTQHHHPACERLLVGGNGGADDEGRADGWQEEDNDNDEDVEGADK
jgi:anti-sigma factor ChrR (cupin superfamily)